MKNRKKILFLLVLIIGVIGSILFFTNQKRELTIDEILKTDDYNYLSGNVKDFIKEHYEETGELYLTEKNFKDNEAYLNPSYIEYLDSNDKDSYNLIPSVTAYAPKITAVNDNLPSSFDLRNVNGKNYVTPNKNQGTEGLCWAYATASLLETHDLIVKDKSYDSTAVLFSEKQMDYALSNNGIIGGNKILNINRSLSEGGSLNYPEKLLKVRLGGYSDDWDLVNSDKIINNQLLEPNIVFNSKQALYEIDETFSLSNINSDYTDTKSIENITRIIKNIIYNYGGATINIKSSLSNFIKNTINGDDLAITSKQYFTLPADQHALHLIGWDDNYEYGFCSGDYGGNYGKFISDSAYYNANHECGTWGNTEQSFEYEQVYGKGAWILKNSWGNDRSYVYLPYDSFIDDIFTITEYSEKNWNDSYDLNKELYYNNSESKYENKWSLDNDLFDGDTIVKIKLNIASPEDILLYFSEDGDANNLTLVGSYSFDSAGLKTIDLHEKNILISKNSFFKTNFGVEQLTLFTTRKDNIIKAYTYDFTYKLEDDFPTNEKFMNVAIKTKLKNIDDNEVINYKLKYKNGDYLPPNSYSLTINKSYYNMATPIIKINQQYAKKGEYVLESWKDNNLLYSSSVVLEVDYMPIEGDGSNENPWQIENIRQFNMIRNALKDNYILMNDLDFEYDTQNENGLFYNYGDGWDAISNFKGNLDGNNKSLKNIKTSSSIFGDIFIFGDCPYNKCGIHNLNVDNLEKYDCMQNVGGIIDALSLVDTYSYDFSNLSITNSHFYVTNKESFSINLPKYFYVGGIVGSLSLHGGSSFKNTVLKIDNWYSNYEYTVNNTMKIMTDGYISGLIGRIDLYSNPILSINNVKTNAKININAGNNINYHVSDIIGGVGYFEGDFNINNSIGVINLEHVNNINVFPNAFVSQFFSENQTNTLKINGVKSNLLYTPNDKITITNFESNLKPYELARNDYSNYSYFENQYYVYNEQHDGTTKVLFEDKFNHIDNTIPMLKHFPEEYAEYAKTYSLKVGETKSINDLIIKDSNNKKLNVYSEFVCDLDLCNNVTDSTIISIPTLQNEYQFTGLKSGSTQLILYDEYSGYLDTVIINVMNGDDYHLTLDYNYDNIIDDSYILTNGNTYGSLPNPNRTGYEFIGWFTERENGSKIEENTIFNNNNDVTLYAHWQINSYTVTFNSNDGSSVASQTIDYNGKVTKPSNPTREGYTFKEWQLNGNTYDFNTPVTENITLTAVWEETENDTLKDILEDNNYTVTNTFVSKFTLGETVTQIKNKLGNDVTIETDKTIIATGAVIRKGTESYTVVIKGDLTGDGKVNSGDLLQMRKYLLEEITLTGAYKEAGIIESIGNIKSLDLLRLRQYLLGDYEFN